MLIKLAAGNQIYWVHEATGEPAEVITGLTGNIEEIVDELKNPGSTERMFEAFFDTELGKTFKDKFGLDTIGPSGRKNIQTVEQTCRILYPEVSLSRFEDAVRVCIDAGELVRPMPVVPATPRPRSENGRFADQRMLLLAEYNRMISDPHVHSSEITRRLQTDRAFREAVESERQAPSTGPLREADIADTDLVFFAEAYRVAPTLKPTQGIITLRYPSSDRVQKFTVADFTDRVNEAIAAGLL